jgi:hypothetical protein
MCTYLFVLGLLLFGSSVLLYADPASTGTNVAQNGVEVAPSGVDLPPGSMNSNPPPGGNDGITAPSGTDQKEMKNSKEFGPIEAPSPRIDQDATIAYSYVGGAYYKSDATGNLGSEQATEFRYGLKIPIDQQIKLQFGLNYTRLDFGEPTGSPLPYSLETLELHFGASYKLSEQWGLFADIAPRLEIVDGWDNIESNDFEIGGVIGATYDPNPNLSIRGGLGINPSGIDIPVLPVIGVRWRFTQDWTLNFGFPRTSIDYQILSNLRVSPLEVGFEGGDFHTSKTYGNSVGDSYLNDRRLYYSEVRLGVGADYAVQKNLHVGLDTGAVVYREFDFHNTGYSPTVDPAPFVQLSARIGF